MSFAKPINELGIFNYTMGSFSVSSEVLIFLFSCDTSLSIIELDCSMTIFSQTVHIVWRIKF